MVMASTTNRTAGVTPKADEQLLAIAEKLFHTKTPSPEQRRDARRVLTKMAANRKRRVNLTGWAEIADEIDNVRRGREQHKPQKITAADRTEARAYHPGKDGVADMAAASADRDRERRERTLADAQADAAQRTTEANRRRSVKGSDSLSALLSFETQVERVVHRGGRKYLIMRDLNGLAHGAQKDWRGIWECTCTPETLNPGCRHQQAAKAHLAGGAR